MQQRYSELAADGVLAEDDDDREIRLEHVLAHVTLMCDAISDDLAALSTMSESVERRDELMHEAGNELIALAELSEPVTPAVANWRDALARLRALAEMLIRSDERGAAQLTDLDLVLERIDRAERVTYEALRSYLGYISA